ncbi:Hypothetical predicted protein, partial [Paramuricea clavata]
RRWNQFVVQSIIISLKEYYTAHGHVKVVGVGGGGGGGGVRGSDVIQLNDECNNEQSKFVSDNVINISSRVLTQAEVSLLSRGLKFCPTPIELDISSVKRDIKEFGRKLKCKAFFLSKIGMEQEGQTFRQFREKSAWCPTEVER